MNKPKLGDFKEQKCIVSVLQPEGHHGGLMRARLPLKAPGKPPFHAFFPLSGSHRHSLACQCIILTPHPLRVLCVSPRSCVCVWRGIVCVQVFPFYRGISNTGLGLT